AVVRAPERVATKVEAPVAAVVTTPAPVPVPAAAPAPVAVPAAPPAAERILAVAELPADIQRELPKLSISGGVHSENAAQRLLIVGGQVVNEGAEVAPGLVLEQIRARTAVLRFRGYRYSVPY
ncbi:MAG TPA: general secretion pathway protein GspB, partial [Ramlibacter sp.]|uniref:general secretion pathway protein GspB n=1 Tax=Ramlibacter sp. TaxID=1917967 RepID=UPI002ED2CAF4